MADGYNRVQLLGNLGADPELRTTGGGQSVLKLRMATAESYKDRDGNRQERTEWHSVVIWGRRAEALSRILSKGSKLFVDGGLHTSSYEKDGEKRYRTEVVAREIILCGGRSDGEPRREQRPRQESKPSGGGGFDDADYGEDPFNGETPF